VRIIFTFQSWDAWHEILAKHVASIHDLGCLSLAAQYRMLCTYEFTSVVKIYFSPYFSILIQILQLKLTVIIVFEAFRELWVVRKTSLELKFINCIMSSVLLVNCNTSNYSSHLLKVYRELISRSLIYQ